MRSLWQQQISVWVKHTTVDSLTYGTVVRVNYVPFFQLRFGMIDINTRRNLWYRNLLCKESSQMTATNDNQISNLSLWLHWFTLFDFVWLLITSRVLSNHRREPLNRWVFSVSALVIWFCIVRESWGMFWKGVSIARTTEDLPLPCTPAYYQAFVVPVITLRKHGRNSTENTIKHLQSTHHKNSHSLWQNFSVTVISVLYVIWDSIENLGKWFSKNNIAPPRHHTLNFSTGKFRSRMKVACASKARSLPVRWAATSVPNPSPVTPRTTPSSTSSILNFVTYVWVPHCCHKYNCSAGNPTRPYETKSLCTGRRKLKKSESNGPCEKIWILVRDYQRRNRGGV